MKNKNIIFVVFGLCLGIAFGLVFDNVAVGVGVCLAIIVGLDIIKNK